MNGAMDIWMDGYEDKRMHAWSMGEWRNGRSMWRWTGIMQNDLTGRKEGNVLFNDVLNTFYLRLYGVRHMVKDHSDSEKGNPLSPHRLLLSINSKGSFICTIPQTVVEHWLEREIAQWVQPWRIDPTTRMDTKIDVCMHEPWENGGMEDQCEDGQMSCRMT